MTKAKKTRSSLTSIVGKNIRRHRIRAGMTQNQLAQELEIEIETVSRYERGVVAPSFTQIESLCNVFGITAWMLFVTEDENRLKVVVPKAPKITLKRDRDFVQSILTALETYKQNGKKKARKQSKNQQAIKQG